MSKLKLAGLLNYILCAVSIKVNFKLGIIFILKFHFKDSSSENMDVNTDVDFLDTQNTFNMAGVEQY